MCDSSASILTVLQGQVDDLDQAQGGDERLTKWLSPMVNVLLSCSDTLGEGVSLFRNNDAGVLSQKVIFAGAGVLLQVAKDVIAAQKALINIFERIENFFKRLRELYLRSIKRSDNGHYHDHGCSTECFRNHDKGDTAGMDNLLTCIFDFWSQLQLRELLPPVHYPFIGICVRPGE
ncbi:hypothetical protein EI94DRAFT_1700270 [Lactarius quietus]|nr:hypothetical protein EI94DRAFT_1700270 [Lactarius quietus]